MSRFIFLEQCNYKILFNNYMRHNNFSQTSLQNFQKCKSEVDLYYKDLNTLIISI